MVNQQMISTRNFQKSFFDCVVTIIDDNHISAVHYRILKEFSQDILKLIFDDKCKVDRFNSQISYLGNRCDTQIQLASNAMLFKK